MADRFGNHLFLQDLLQDHSVKKKTTFAGPGCDKQQRRHLEVPGCCRGAAGGDQPQAGKVITGDYGDNDADGDDYDDADNDDDEEKKL